AVLPPLPLLLLLLPLPPPLPPHLSHTRQLAKSLPSPSPSLSSRTVSKKHWQHQSARLLPRLTSKRE
ncbi:hypothetical protein C0995_013381, partial [Termitomyces sp. Mi166